MAGRKNSQDSKSATSQWSTMACGCALSSLSDVCSLFCDSQLQRNQLSVKEVDMGSIFGSIENVGCWTVNSAK